MRIIFVAFYGIFSVQNLRRLSSGFFILLRIKFKTRNVLKIRSKSKGKTIELNFSKLDARILILKLVVVDEIISASKEQSGRKFMCESIFLCSKTEQFFAEDEIEFT